MVIFLSFSSMDQNIFFYSLEIPKFHLTLYKAIYPLSNELLIFSRCQIMIKEKSLQRGENKDTRITKIV